MSTDSERFWPSLRDRLKDQRPDGLPQDDHFLTAEQLREQVKRSLENLFNSTSLDSTVGMDAYPRMRRSVLNFGVPDLTGKTQDGNVDSEKPLKFEIIGEIYATPVPEQIFVSSTWDVDLAKAAIAVELG
jgi:type VI secretion system protein ImpF